MKKLYALFLAAIMVLAIGATTLAMDFYTYAGGEFYWNLTDGGNGMVLGDGYNDFYYPAEGTGVWLELGASQKLSDNVTIGTKLGYWYESYNQDGMWEAWCGPSQTYIKINNVLDLFNIAIFNNHDDKDKSFGAGAKIANYNWFNQKCPAIDITAAPAEGFTMAATIYQPIDGGGNQVPDEFGFGVKGTFASDAFTFTAGYASEDYTGRTAYSVGLDVNAIEALKLGFMYGSRNTTTAYILDGTFTGIEGLSITGKYGHKDAAYGAYAKTGWGPAQSYYKDMAAWFEVTGNAIDMIYVGASYNLMEGLTVGGSYAQDSISGDVEYAVNGNFAVTEGIGLFASYRSLDSAVITKVGANIALGGPANLQLFYLNDDWYGGTYMGAEIYASLW